MDEDVFIAGFIVGGISCLFGVFLVTMNYSFVYKEADDKVFEVRGKYLYVKQATDEQIINYIRDKK